MNRPLKILVTGKRGQVGWELQRTLMPLGHIFAVDRESMNLADSSAIVQTIAHLKPDVIVNAAAYTAVDKAETEQSLAMQINGQAVQVLAEEAKKHHALLIHYSTDYVFDGTKSHPYSENDSTAPINYYGVSKLAGEQAIQAVASDYLILRTSWVYGNRGNNFLLTMLRLMQERETLTIVSDQHGTPTWSRFIAETTAHIIKQALQERTEQLFSSGIYHLTATGDTSWHGFAEMILQLAKKNAWQPELKIKTLDKIGTAHYPTPAKRPLNSRMATEALCERFSLHLPVWDEALALCMERLHSSD